MAEEVVVDSAAKLAPPSFKKNDFKSHNAFLKAKQSWDSLQKVTSKLQMDSVAFTKDLEHLRSDFLRVQNEYNDLKKKKDQTDSLLTVCQGKDTTIVDVFGTLPGCSVVIALIIALTILGIKKGFVFSKGDTKFSTGDEKKD